MPGQARIITPNTTDARPCRPIAQRILLTCVRETFAARSTILSIFYLRSVGASYTTKRARRRCQPAATAGSGAANLRRRLLGSFSVNRLRELEDLTRELE